jgi:hypothetical protein
MAEQQVLRADDPRVWEFLLESPSDGDRKRRLLACACCRAVWKWLGRLEQRAVDVAERYADGRADDEERQSLADEAWYGWAHVYGRSLPTILGLLADHISDRECGDLCRTVLAVRGPVAREAILAELRDEIFGPTRPAELDPALRAWHGGVVVALARAIDADGHFGAMPVLADALEEAGCTDEEIFGHCRRRRRHVRGCWVVDLVLAKESW